MKIERQTLNMSLSEWRALPSISVMPEPQQQAYGTTQYRAGSEAEPYVKLGPDQLAPRDREHDTVIAWPARRVIFSDAQKKPRKTANKIF